MSKHTPGPWEAFTEDSFSGWWAIRQITDDGLNHEVGSSDGGFDEADARLMAAAPDLLEALQAMVQWQMDSMSGKETNGYPGTQAMAAIRKALGDSKP